MGGLCTNGYISGIAGLVEGLCEEWVDRLAAKGAAIKRPHLPVIEPEMGKMELEQMLLQAGCRILYGVQVVDCIVEDGRIESVIAYSKSGRMEIRAKVFIDCTGDADLAFAGGVPCEVGNAEYCGLNQSVTMGFRLSYVNVKRYEEAEAAFQKTKSSRPACNSWWPRSTRPSPTAIFPGSSSRACWSTRCRAAIPSAAT